MQNEIKVGLISCSGEEIPEGTLSRAAVRLVLEKLRPLQTVTICLPLFLAGDGGERAFAERYPTITIDGCGRRCAQKGTEKYSGTVDDAIIIEELLAEMGEKAPASRRDLTSKDWEVAEKAAGEIARRVDMVLAKAAAENRGAAADSAPLPACGCSSPGPAVTSLELQGKKLDLVAIDAIFTLVGKNMALTDRERAGELARQAAIYNAIPPDLDRALLGEMLLQVYRQQVNRR